MLTTWCHVCMQMDVVESSSTAGCLPTAVLRLRPRQLPSFCVTLRVIAAPPSSSLSDAGLPATASPQPAPVAAPTLPVSPAGPMSTRWRLSPIRGEQHQPSTAVCICVVCCQR